MPKKSDNSLGKAIARVAESVGGVKCVSVVLPLPLIDKIDAVAGEQLRTRSGQIQFFIEVGLKAVGS